MARRSRKTATRYTDGEIGRLKVVKNFLPAPDELVLRGKTEKARRKPPVAPRTGKR